MVQAPFLTAMRKVYTRDEIDIAFLYDAGITSSPYPAGFSIASSPCPAGLELPHVPTKHVPGMKEKRVYELRLNTQASKQASTSFATNVESNKNE